MKIVPASHPELASARRRHADHAPVRAARGDRLEGPAVLAAGAGRGDGAAEADAAPHAAAAGSGAPAAARGRRPPLQHRHAAAPPGREPAHERQPPWRPPRRAAPSRRADRRELQHHHAVGQRSGLSRPRRDGRAAALLPAPRLARAGALLGQRQGLPGADDAGATQAPARARAARALHAKHADRAGAARARAQAGAARRLRGRRRGVPARPGLPCRARAGHQSAFESLRRAAGADRAAGSGQGTQLPAGAAARGRGAEPRSMPMSSARPRKAAGA